MTPKVRKRNKVILAVSLAILLILVALTVTQSRFNSLPHLLSEAQSSNNDPVFPNIDTSTLSATQIKIIDVAKNEYKGQPKGTKYSEGANESWCADFVSWVYKQSDHPFNNPNSGSWRIPGTYTLRDYFTSSGTFKPARSGYSPKAGDVMLYDNPSSFGQHTNIVIQNKNSVITTVGGNESGRIRVHNQLSAESPGFVGYGVLSS